MEVEKEKNSDSDDFLDDLEESSISQNYDLLSFRDYHFKEKSIYEDDDKQIEYGDALFFNFPYNVYFKQEDFINDVHVGCKYDTITWYIKMLIRFMISFSVTKWVHLNWGDDGLMYLLLKCYSLLKKYGMLILECQPFSSYHKKRDYSEKIKQNYASIKIKPEQIPSILQKMGMQLIASKKPSNSPLLSKTVTKGFNRPVSFFKKVGEEIDIDFSTVQVENLREVYDVESLLTPPVV